MKSKIIYVFAMALIVNCGGTGDGDAGAGAGFGGPQTSNLTYPSCDTRGTVANKDLCYEWTYDGGPEAAQAWCNQYSGVYSNSAKCPASGKAGGCKKVISTTRTQITYGYAPTYSAASAQSQCQDEFIP